MVSLALGGFSSRRPSGWAEQLVTSQSANSGEDAHKLLPGGHQVGRGNWWRHNLQTQVKTLTNCYQEAMRLGAATGDVTICKLRWRRSQIATRRPWGRARQLVTSPSANSGEDAHKLLLWGHEIGWYNWWRASLQTQVKTLTNCYYEAGR